MILLKITTLIVLLACGFPGGFVARWFWSRRSHNKAGPKIRPQQPTLSSNRDKP